MKNPYLMLKQHGFLQQRQPWESHLKSCSISKRVFGWWFNVLFKLNPDSDDDDDDDDDDPNRPTVVFAIRLACFFNPVERQL